MKRSETRYRGVWDAGYEAAMVDANRDLADAIVAGAEFAPPGNRWDQNLITIRIGNRIYDTPKQYVIQILPRLVGRAVREVAYEAAD